MPTSFLPEYVVEVRGERGRIFHGVLRTKRKTSYLADVSLPALLIGKKSSPVPSARRGVDDVASAAAVPPRTAASGSSLEKASSLNR